MRRHITKSVIVAAVSLSAIFSLASCENAAEVARKPALVEPIVQDSLKRCDTGKDPGRRISPSDTSVSCAATSRKRSATFPVMTAAGCGLREIPTASRATSPPIIDGRKSAPKSPLV